jgi:hypothetical protein
MEGKNKPMFASHFLKKMFKKKRIKVKEKHNLMWYLTSKKTDLKKRIKVKEKHNLLCVGISLFNLRVHGVQVPHIEGGQRQRLLEATGIQALPRVVTLKEKTVDREMKANFF